MLNLFVVLWVGFYIAIDAGPSFSFVVSSSLFLQQLKGESLRSVSQINFFITSRNVAAKIYAKIVGVWEEVFIYLKISLLQGI